MPTDFPDRKKEPASPCPWRPAFQPKQSRRQARRAWCHLTLGSLSQVRGILTSIDHSKLARAQHLVWKDLVDSGDVLRGGERKVMGANRKKEGKKRVRETGGWEAGGWVEPGVLGLAWAGLPCNGCGRPWLPGNSSLPWLHRRVRRAVGRHMRFLLLWDCARGQLLQGPAALGCPRWSTVTWVGSPGWRRAGDSSQLLLGASAGNGRAARAAPRVAVSSVFYHNELTGSQGRRKGALRPPAGDLPRSLGSDCWTRRYSETLVLGRGVSHG